MNPKNKLPEKLIFQPSSNNVTVFLHHDNRLWLSQLFGMHCGLNNTDTGPDITRGLCILDTADHRYEGDDFCLIEAGIDEERLDLCWEVGNGLLWRSNWQLQPEAGIWSRRDSLENNSHSPIEIRRCQARVPFAPGQYEIYTQSSNWARENQGHWNKFFGGRLSLRSYSGRTTQIANPYLFICELGADHGIAFHILPRGNWSIHVDRTSTTRDELSPFNVIELGLSDNTLQIKISPGDKLELPEILIQAIASNQPEAGSAALHGYILDKYFADRKTAPVVYNTWFDTFDSIDVHRLRLQLTIAKEIGCEVFTIDAGWYGRGAGNWHSQVGDWREKLDGAFHGEMGEFAKEVRAVGLGFGLWVEPERYSPQSPIVQTHPEWFLPGLGGFFYPDLSQHSAYEYTFNELARLVENYQLAWMKIDFNFELGNSTDELSTYFAHWYQLMDELRAKYPGTFFEGCASGGMRFDLNTLNHFDGHFLSDTVNPIDVLRISQGAMLRLPPGHIARWAVMRAHNEQVLTPGGGGWDNAMQADVDFICRVALPGMFGLSGDLTGLTEEIRIQLRNHIAFYKEWRKFIRSAVCHLLTPIRNIDDRSGWVAFQLQNPSQPGTTIMFVYRLLDGLSSKTFHPKELIMTRIYSITHIDSPKTSQFISGNELYSSGLQVDLPHPNSAAIVIIR